MISCLDMLSGFFFVTREKKEKKQQKQEKIKKKKELLSRIESSNCIHPEEVQEISWRRDMVEQLSIQICSKLGHRIRTLIILSKSG